MLEPLVERLTRTHANNQHILSNVRKFEVRALDQQFSEICLFCGGAGHSLGIKCPTYIVMCEVMTCCTSGAFAKAFAETLKLQFDNYNNQAKAKAELNDQFRMKTTTLGMQNRVLVQRLTQLNQKKEAKKAEKLKFKLFANYQRQMEEEGQ